MIVALSVEGVQDGRRSHLLEQHTNAGLCVGGAEGVHRVQARAGASAGRLRRHLHRLRPHAAGQLSLHRHHLHPRRARRQVGAEAGTEAGAEAGAEAAAGARGHVEDAGGGARGVRESSAGEGRQQRDVVEGGGGAHRERPALHGRLASDLSSRRCARPASASRSSAST